MEALQILIEMVKDLPDMALWVVGGFFVYKTVIIGSLYGVIKLAITKLHDAIVAKKTAPVVEKDYRETIDRLCITGCSDTLIAQLARLVSTGGYIHSHEVNFLRIALDDAFEKKKEGVKND